MKHDYLNANLNEGEVINHWLRSRFGGNKNALIAVVGSTGSGKSYACMRMAELWYKDYFNKEFPSTHICFSIREAMLLIQSGKLTRGDLIIVEEAGVIMNSLDFQNKIVKFFGFVLQSFRSKNIGIIFNLPHIDMLTKTARLLMHGLFETAGIDSNAKKVKIKALYCQTNPRSSKQYHKYLKYKINGRFQKIKRISYSLPRSDLLKEYEDKKDIFVNKNVENLIEITGEDDKKEESKAKFKQLIEEAYYAGYKTMKQMAEYTGITCHALSKRGVMAIIMELNAKNRPKPLENAPL